MSDDGRFSDAALLARLTAGPVAHAEPIWAPALGERPAAVLVPLLRTHDDLRVLLTRRSSGLSKHAGEFAFPGGRPDPGDGGPLQTALREAHEEVGLPPELVRILSTLPPTSTYATAFAITPFVGVIDDRLVWTSHEAEVAEVVEPRLADLWASRQVHAFERDGETLQMPSFPLDQERLVWGATARILDELLHRLAPLLEAGDAAPASG